MRTQQIKRTPTESTVLTVKKQSPKKLFDILAGPNENYVSSPKHSNANKENTPYLNVEVQKMRTEVNKLKTQLLTTISKNKKLKILIENETTNNKLSGLKVTELEEEIERLNQSHKEQLELLQKENKKITSEKESLQIEKTSLAEEVRKLQSQIVFESDEQVNKRRQSLSYFPVEKKDCSECQNLLSTIELISTELDLANNTIDNLKISNDISLNEHQKELSQQLQVNEESKAVIDSLTEKYNQEVENKSKLEYQMNALEIKSQHSKQLTEKVTKQNNNLEKEMKDLNDKYHSLENNHQQLLEEIEVVNGLMRTRFADEKKRSSLFEIVIESQRVALRQANLLTCEVKVAAETLKSDLSKQISFNQKLKQQTAKLVEQHQKILEINEKNNNLQKSFVSERRNDNDSQNQEDDFWVVLESDISSYKAQLDLLEKTNENNSNIQLNLESQIQSLNGSIIQLKEEKELLVEEKQSIVIERESSEKMAKTKSFDMELQLRANESRVNELEGKLTQQEKEKQIEIEKLHSLLQQRESELQQREQQQKQEMFEEKEQQQHQETQQKKEIELKESEIQQKLEINTKYEELNEQLIEKENSRISLKNELELLRNELEEIRNKLFDSENNLNGKVGFYEEEKLKFLEKIEILNEDISNLNEENISSSDIICQLREEIEVIESEKNSLNNELVVVCQELNEYRLGAEKNEDEFALQYERLNRQIEKLEANLIESTKNNESIKLELSVALNEKESLIDELEKTNEDLQSAQESINSRDENIRQLESQAIEFNRSVCELEREIELLTDDLIEDEFLTDELFTEVDELKEANQNVEQIVEGKFKKDIDNYIKQVNQLDSQIEEEGKNNELLFSELEKVTELKDSLEAELKEIMNTLNNKEDRIVELESSLKSNEELKNQIVELSKKKERDINREGVEKSVINNSEQETIDYQLLLEDKNIEIQTMKQKCQQFQIEIEDLNENLKNSYLKFRNIEAENEANKQLNFWLVSSSSSMDLELKEKKDIISNNIKECQKLKDEITYHNEVEKKLNSELELNQKIVSELKKEIENISKFDSNELINTKTKSFLLEKNYQSLKKKEEKLKLKLSINRKNAKNEVIALKNIVNQIENSNELERNQLKEEISQLQERINKALDYVPVVVESVKENTQNSSDNVNNVAMVVELENSMKEMKEKIVFLEKENNSLISLDTYNKSLLLDNSKSYESLLASFNELKKKMESQSNENSHLKEANTKIEFLKKELNESHSRLSLLHQDYLSANEKVEHYKNLNEEGEKQLIELMKSASSNITSASSLTNLISSTSQNLSDINGLLDQVRVEEQEKYELKESELKSKLENENKNLIEKMEDMIKSLNDEVSELKENENKLKSKISEVESNLIEKEKQQQEITEKKVEEKVEEEGVADLRKTMQFMKHEISINTRELERMKLLVKSRDEVIAQLKLSLEEYRDFEEMNILLKDTLAQRDKEFNVINMKNKKLQATLQAGHAEVSQNKQSQTEISNLQLQLDDMILNNKFLNDKIQLQENEIERLLLIEAEKEVGCDQKKVDNFLKMKKEMNTLKAEYSKLKEIQYQQSLKLTPQVKQTTRSANSILRNNNNNNNNGSNGNTTTTTATLRSARK